MNPYHSPSPPSLIFSFVFEQVCSCFNRISQLLVGMYSTLAQPEASSTTMASVEKNRSRKTLPIQKHISKYSFPIFPLRENCQSTSIRFPSSSRLLPILNRSSHAGMRPGISTLRGYSGFHRASNVIERGPRMNRT